MIDTRRKFIEQSKWENDKAANADGSQSSWASLNSLGSKGHDKRVDRGTLLVTCSRKDEGLGIEVKI